MAIFKKQAYITKGDLLLAFAACVIPIHIWSILGLLEEVPAWLVRMNAWELVGAVAYTQFFALLESLAIWLLLVLILGILTPARLLNGQFLALGSVMVFVHALWAVAVHLNYQDIREWGSRQFLPWLVLYLLSVVAAWLLVTRAGQVQRAVRALMERLSILSYVYVFVDVLSIFVIFFRNW